MATGFHLLYLTRCTMQVLAQSIGQLRALSSSISSSTVMAGQAGNVTAEAAGTAECARFVKLLRLCILTTDMGFPDGGSCGAGASAFTMVVVGV